MRKKEKYSLAYIILTFPKKSERFIFREVATITNYTGPILVYSIKDGEYNPSVDKKVKVTYLSSQSIWKVFRAHLILLCSYPLRYFRTLSKYILIPYMKIHMQKSSISRRRKAAKRLRIYLKAGIIAADIIRKGVCHIHAHYAHWPAETAMRISHFTGIPFSFTAHAKDLFLREKSKLLNLIRKSSCVFTCSQDGETFLRGRVKPKYQRKINCVHHGIPQSFVNSPCTYRKGLTEPIILSAGRFTEKKGFDTLLISLSILRRRGIKFKCIIAGDGKLSAKIKDSVRVFSLEKVVDSPGFVSEKTLARLYRKSTIFALACRQLLNGDRDGIPNVILEAMASGLPVISTRVGGIPEVIKNGYNGYLTEPDDPEAFADAMEALIKNIKSREQMGKIGRRLVLEKFNLEENTKKFYGLLLKHSSKLNLSLDNYNEIRN